jgi:hypothetical protein
VADFAERVPDAGSFDPMDAFGETFCDHFPLYRVEVFKVARARQFIGDLDNMRQAPVVLGH